jgi:hypothetical protein
MDHSFTFGFYSIAQHCMTMTQDGFVTSWVFPAWGARPARGCVTVALTSRHGRRVAMTSDMGLCGFIRHGLIGARYGLL